MQYGFSNRSPERAQWIRPDTQREVLNISDESNTLIVKRNSGDIVSIGNGWTQGSNETILGNIFAVYTQGRATLKVQTVSNSSVANRQIFYYRATSSVFGNGSGQPLKART